MKKIKQIWRRLWMPTKKKWLLGIPIGGFVAVFTGIIALATFNGIIHATNSNTLCYSCHVGMDTVVEEYKDSIHFSNAKGIRADCADCHVPNEFFAKMAVKIKATKDIYHQLAGTINLDNFEQKRVAMAEGVYKTMKNRDSQECRNCHNPDTWNTSFQSTRAKNHHNPSEWKENNQTCVDCHAGIAHKRPVIK